MNFLLEKTTESVQQIKLELKTTKETWAELVKKKWRTKRSYRWVYRHY
ncbi:hypothetical protein [Mycoplasma capricolum]|nr:hypothetical protein [Mycoplasma capricolum]